MPLSSKARSNKGVRNVVLRFHGPDSEEFAEADLAYRRISTEERVAEILAKAPPFTDDQVGRLTVLLARRASVPDLGDAA